MPFRVIEHTADVGIEATGATLEEALEQLVAGFTHILLEEGATAVIPHEQWSFTVEAPDTVRLAIDVIDRLNLDFELENLVPFRAGVALETLASGVRGIFTIEGETYDAQRHGHPLDIKAATLHNAIAERLPGREGSGAVVRVLVDI